MLQTLLSPNSIAIIGGSDDVSKPGGLVTQNILSQGFVGELLIVNPKKSLVQGVRAFPSIKDLPLVPELALIAVPAQFVKQSLEELAIKGTRVVIVISSGFGELSSDGKLEEECLAGIANRYNMLLLGPNCLGVMTVSHASKFAGLLPDMVSGGIDFLSSSGATIDYFAEQSIRRGLTFNSLLSVGNSAQSGVADLLTLFDQNPRPDFSQIKLLYLESLKTPQLFLKAARSLTKKGYLLAGIKSGTTQAGKRAAASHTGAMATNDVAMQALFEKAGVIRVQSRLDLVDVACALVYTKGELKKKRVCVISDAGGPGVMLADELNRQGFSVPILKEHTQEKLVAILPSGAGVSNPIDCMPTRNGEMILQVLETICNEEAEAIDCILFMVGDSRLADNWEIFQSVIQAINTFKLPIIPSFSSAISSRDALDKFRQAGKCYFEDEVSLARALSRVVNRPRISEPVLEIPGYDRKKIEALLAGKSGTLSPATSRHALEAAGLRFPGQVELAKKSDLEKVSFPFPWVMKVIGPLHKSDLGGVRMGIPDLETAYLIWDELIEIQDASGCLIQQTVAGPEVLIGANREEGFGHLIGFGLGGIYTEALKDVNYRLAPLSNEEAEDLIHSIRSIALFEGFRGEPAISLSCLQEWLIKISLLVTDFPHIRELDLNPVKGSGSEIYVVDARIIMD